MHEKDFKIVRRNDKKTVFKTVEIKEHEHKQLMEDEYNKVLKPLLEFFNQKIYSDIEKLQYIYTYLVNKCEIDLGEPDVRTNPISRFEKKYLYQGNDLACNINKYGPVLIGKGVCKGFSEAFKDIAQKCGVEVEIIEGTHHGEGHAWIIVNDEGIIKHIDVYDGIMQKKINKIYEFFMLTSEELKFKGKHRNFENELEEKKKNLPSYKEVRPGFKIRK